MESIQYTSLSQPRRRLLRLFQWINFGQMQGLVVHEGEPLFDPPPKILRTIKFGTAPSEKGGANDYLLKQQALEMFHHFDRLQNTTIVSLDVKAGLPFRMTLDDTDDLSSDCTSRVQRNA